MKIFESFLSSFDPVRQEIEENGIFQYLLRSVPPLSLQSHTCCQRRPRREDQGVGRETLMA